MGHHQTNGNPATFFLQGTLLTSAPVAIPAALYLYATGVFGLGSWSWWKGRQRRLADADTNRVIASKSIPMTGIGGINTMLKQIKQMTAAIAFMVVAFVGTTPAHALQFNAGDAVLALYGNGTEYYRKLGTISSLTSGGVSPFTIDNSFMSQLGGANPIQYTIVGVTGPNFSTTPTTTIEGSKIAASNTSSLSGWTSTRNGSIQQNTYFLKLGQWQNLLSTISGTEHTLSAGDPAAFTQATNFGTGNTLGGSFPLQMSTALDTTLHLLTRAFLPNGNTTAQTELGTAMLTAGGLFTFTAGAAPVPVPAAAVLFATGMIGLVGIARRSMGLSRKAHATNAVSRP